LDPIDFLLSRPVIITAAIAGAAIASMGPGVMKKLHWGGAAAQRRVMRLGYAISWGSVVLFIAAGFFSRPDSL
jgi:hypothetical protein